MADSKEMGGIVLAFGGFVFLVMAVKGTWGNTWRALTGKPVAASSSSKSSAPSGFPGTAPNGGLPAGGAVVNPPGISPSSPFAPFPGGVIGGSLPLAPAGTRNV